MGMLLTGNSVGGFTCDWERVSEELIPSCVVWEICRRYPSEDGKYTGFKSSSEEVTEIDFSWDGGMK